MRPPAEMKTGDLRIVFMGTPEFAVASLKILRENGLNIVAVVTAPDKPAGRGKRLQQSAVKKYALQHGIYVLQPEKLKAPGFINELKQLAPHLQVVVAFRMLPEAVWSIPPLGTFNLHASLLPDYRGAAPINHVIINGEKRTGVTTFLIDEQIDTGNILLQEEIAVSPDETAGELHDRLMGLGAALVLETVSRLASGTVHPRPQKELAPGTGKWNTAPKIAREDCLIDWSAEGPRISSLIRGLSPCPGAFTYVGRPGDRPVMIKIFRAKFEPGSHRIQQGTPVTDGKNELKIAVKDGYIRVDSLQQEGKRRMEVKEFLLGFRLISGEHRFSSTV